MKVCARPALAWFTRVTAYAEPTLAIPAGAHGALCKAMTLHIDG